MPTETAAVTNACAMLRAIGHEHEADAVEAMARSHAALLEACEAAENCDHTHTPEVLQQLRDAIAQSGDET